MLSMSQQGDVAQMGEHPVLNRKVKCSNHFIPFYRIFSDSSMVEHATVNRRVAGSSPVLRVCTDDDKVQSAILRTSILP